jgi:acyl phosphate:glycerol-3-phosphate acyltransferase
MPSFLLILFAYLIGSVPTALWVSRFFFGIDIREHGSKNMGASNVYRVLGPLYGLLVLAVDIGKGVLAVQLSGFINPLNWLGSETEFWKLLLGLTAVLGHIFPIFAGFRGGKGVATLFGVVIAIQPWIALISIFFFAVVVFITRYVSLGSIAGAIVFAGCVFFVFRESNLYIRWFAGIAALLVLFLHRSNIARLWRGKENKISIHKKRRKDP